MQRGAIATERRGERTAVTRLYAESPLRLLHAKKQRRAAWIYQTNLGGGLVGGDAIGLDIEAGVGTTTLLTSQSSTKIYGGALSRQELSVRTDDDALAVVLNDPIVCFRGARYEQTLRFDLAANGSLVMLDWLTCGRRAFGERWCFERFDSRMTLAKDKTPLITDRTLLEGNDVGERMQRFDVVGVLWLVGPRVRIPSELVADTGVQAALSMLADDVAIVRFAATDLEAATRVLAPTLTFLDSALGGFPWTRKH